MPKWFFLQSKSKTEFFALSQNLETLTFNPFQSCIFGLMEMEALYSCFLRSAGICTDSRSLKPGQMFWALKGPSFNGNTFAEKALQLGAGFVVVDEDVTIKDNRILYVSDGLKALQNLANHHRLVWGKEVIAVCGSNGKTTTKELISRALAVGKNVFSTPGNFNNHIGVPLSLLQLKTEHEIAVIEMGANHPGEIAELCEIAEPDSGLITNIGKDHLEGFGSLEGSANANAELFDFLENKDGIAFINSDDEWNRKLKSKISKHFTFPNSEDNAPCQNLESDFFLKIKIPELEALTTNLTGIYNFNNLACALAISRYYGIDDQKALEAVASYSPSNNRSQVIRTERNTIISDAYNANPSSVLAALENLHSLKSDSKIAILGDMLELGVDSEKEHFELGKWTSQNSEIQYFVTGKEMKSFAQANSNSLYFEVKSDLENHLSQNKISNSVILLKGSRGMKLETLLPLL